MIEIIVGTNRPGSNTLKVARIIEGYYKEAGVPTGLLDLHELPPEIFLPSAYGEKPAAFAPLQDRVTAAHGLHIVIPEYNGSFPGVLKYFVDMLKFPESFEHKCTAYTGVAAGVWGGLRAVEQLQLVFGYRNAYNCPERVWIAGVHKKLSADGASFADEATADILRKQVAAFAPFAARHRNA